MKFNLDLQANLRICQKDDSMEELWDKSIDISANNTNARANPAIWDLFYNKMASGQNLLSLNSLGSGFTDILVDIGNGSEVTFSKTFSAFYPIDIESVVLKWTEGAISKTGSTDSVGNLSGIGIASGSIATDGTFTVTFSIAPDAGTAITLEFDRGTDEVTSLFFDLAVDETVHITDTADFANKLNLPYVKTNFDWIETVVGYSYRASMVTTYTGAETDPITGAIAYAKTLNLNERAMETKILLRSIAPSKDNDMFPNGIILNEGDVGQCLITCELRLDVPR